MKLFSKAFIVVIALTPLIQSCTFFSTSVDGVSNVKTELVKGWRKHKGWKSMCLANGFIEIYIVPEIGGRIIQYKLGDKEFFWVNPQLAGKLPTPTGLTPDGGWLNYGGDKLWLAPQGWDNNEQWPGPPDAVLDGLPYTMEQLPIDKNGAEGIRLTSRKDPRSGIRFSRVIRLHPDGTRVSIEATMTNVDNKPRRWGIWAHTQFDSGKADGSGHNSLLNAWCPINPKSHFPKGYRIIFGEKNNPAFQPDYANGMMKVNYQYRVAKIGMDSHAGWVATVDGESGSAFIQRFTFESDKPYPDGSSVEFWLNGLGRIHAYNKDIDMPTTVSENPYVFESEVLSPFAKLAPGESYTYRYEWLSTNVGGNYPIVNCTAAGVVCEPLNVTPKGKRLFLTGRFGVFSPGSLRLLLYDKREDTLLTHVISKKVSPLQPVIFDHSIDLPATTADVILEWISEKGDRECVLGRTTVH